MPGLIGRKIGMTSVFSADGKNVPCTVIEAGPCVVTQVKTVEKDGYKAVQLGFAEAKEKNTTKPMMGVFKKAGTTPKRHLAEFKFDEELNLGDTVTVDLFNDVEYVDVVEQFNCDCVTEVMFLVKLELGQVLLWCCTSLLEDSEHWLGGILLFSLTKSQLKGSIAILLYGLHLSNNTRTSFDNSARYILTVGTENGCHSDFSSN